MHAQIVLFDGFDPLDVIAPYEVLHAGGAASGGLVTVELVSAEGPREVVSGTGGLALRATAGLDPERADLVLVPGASGRVGEPGEAAVHTPGAGDRQQDEPVPVLLGRTLTTGLPALLRTAVADPGVTVAAVCGGTLVLAMAGLLEGRHATTHHLGLDMLDATGVHAVRARVVDDGDVVTGAGVTSGLDLALHLLEREVGPRVAHAVEELFAHERRGIVWRDRGPVAAAL
ncbi:MULTISPECIES: DJ-1/PfpI family protein [unclassified Streptomyces]|uniref:DJ-1/PfpI family protein n=1 Tax=unclassified Streptomyces TaxID=2593676 RepID=UPI002E151A0D|nr:MULTISPECIES: DJ-1/PfpI family protein [unclassified Streptomyces]WSQ87471.1 DJ-1/PfpI family protein [Streptomyces sp. NBC_01212]WSR06518.1 DJ-1/PfpI family protein [Streptomyces sp. NBC_01208]